MLVVRRRGKKVEEPRQNPKKPQRKNGGSTGEVFFHPPPIPSYTLQHRCRMRFIVIATLAGQSITWSNLIDTIGFVASATSGYNVFREVKVNEIEVWDIAANQGAVSTISVLWNENDSNQAGDGRLVSDMSLGVVPAHVRTRPTKNSLSSKWHIGFGPNTVNAFQISASGGCVIDVDLSYRGNGTGQVNGEALALVGGIVGATFWRGLDGLAVATTKFIANTPIYQL